MTVLAFDVGKTGCRATLFDGTAVVASTEEPGSVGIAESTGTAAAVHAMLSAARRVAGPGPVETVSAGLAGLGRVPGAARSLTAALAEQFPSARVLLFSDMVTSHAGALQGRPGVVVAAGTGAVALAVDADGRRRTSDGWGYLLGDEGSGYAIGRAGLAGALQHHDGRGGSPTLHRLAEERFGPMEALPATVHGSANPARLVASFARDVQAAAGRGDALAQAIWADAGRRLARTTAAAATLLPRQRLTVATTGGLFGAGDLLLQPFLRELTTLIPTVALTPAVGDALDGARLLATDDSLPHHALALRGHD